MFISAINDWGPMPPISSMTTMFSYPFGARESISLLPLNPRWENFIDVWDFSWRPLMNTVLVYFSSTLLLLLACSLTGYVLAKHKFRGSHALFMLILAQVIIQGVPSLFPFPGIINWIPMFTLMNWLGWVGTYWSLIIPGVFNAYTIFLMRQYIITIPDDVLDAARLSGCSEFGLYWRIILPLSKPALVVLGLINFVWRWNDFLWPMFMDLDTIQTTLFDLRVIQATHLPWVAACITIATLPLIIFAIIFTIIFQKDLIIFLKHFSKGFAHRNREMDTKIKEEPLLV